MMLTDTVDQMVLQQISLLTYCFLGCGDPDEEEDRAAEGACF